MKKKIKKGFTLVELIVVMAIFSIIMVAVMSLIDPVSKIYKNTAVAEKTYANANSIQTYLQTHLEYAESMVVATSDNIGNKDGTITSDEMNALINEYGKSHFNYIVAATSKGDTGSDLNTLGNVCYVRGNIHVLRLINNGPNRGQILHSVYPFVSNDSSNNGFALVDPDSVTGNFEINPAFFNARDARYNYSYALGGCRFINVPTPSGGDTDSAYKALDRDFDYDPAHDPTDPDGLKSGTGISQSNFSISIVVDKAGKNNQGSIDVTKDNGVEYRAFRCPATIQATPLSFTAMNTRSNTLYAVSRPYKKPGDDKIEYQDVITPESDNGCGWSYLTKSIVDGTELVSEQINFNEDIYFIYAYTDEIEADTSNPIA